MIGHTNCVQVKKSRPFTAVCRVQIIKQCDDLYLLRCNSNTKRWMAV
jgi:hypothetical protein